jgi:hypothetical protein
MTTSESFVGEQIVPQSEYWVSPHRSTLDVRHDTGGLL